MCLNEVLLIDCVKFRTVPVAHVDDCIDDFVYVVF